MSNGRKRGLGTFAASILLAASAPAWAAKPPPPPPPPDPYEVCFPWGSSVWGVDCCPIYPQLCEGQALDEPAVRPEQELRSLEQ